MPDQKPKLFHVDDEDGILKLMKRLLSNDFEMKQSSNLEEALPILEKEDFDIYISDGLEGGWRKVYGTVRSKELVNGKDYSGCKPFIVHTSNLDTIEKVRKDMNYDKKLALIQKPSDIFELKEYILKLYKK